MVGSIDFHIWISLSLHQLQGLCKKNPVHAQLVNHITLKFATKGETNVKVTVDAEVGAYLD